MPFKARTAVEPRSSSLSVAPMRAGAVGRLWSAADPYALGFVDPAALTDLAERMRGSGPRQQRRIVRHCDAAGGGATGAFASSALAQEWSPQMMAAVQRRTHKESSP